MKATFTLPDGSTVDLFDQAYTDAAVAAALAGVGSAPTEVVHVAPGDSVEVEADKAAE